MNIKKILVGAAASAVMLSMAFPAFAANPSADVDCSTTVTDPYGILGTGTRAELYGCKPIGNSGEEQGIYTLDGPATLFGYPADYGTCKILVKWSGDYGLHLILILEQSLITQNVPTDMLRYGETNLMQTMHMEQLHTFTQLVDKVHRFTHKSIGFT